MESNFILIDGSIDEGGGQILRNSLALSCILKKPVKISNIRANRPEPGLKKQHLAGLTLLENIYQATVSGNQLGSPQISFDPTDIKYNTKYSADAQGAGSIGLVLQAALPVSLFNNAYEEINISVRGGTLNIKAELEIEKHGFFPKGGGKVNLKIKTLNSENVKNLQPIQLLDRGEIQKIEVISQFCLGWTNKKKSKPAKFDQSFVSKVENLIRDKFRKMPQVQSNIVEYKSVKVDSPSGSFSVNINIYTSTGCILNCNSSNKDQHSTHHEVAEPLYEQIDQVLNSETCTDEFLQDQLLIFASLTNGTSQIRTLKKVSDHSKSAFYVLRQFFPDIKIEIQELENSSIISITNNFSFQ